MIRGKNYKILFTKPSLTGYAREKVPRLFSTSDVALLSFRQALHSLLIAFSEVLRYMARSLACVVFCFVPITSDHLFYVAARTDMFYDIIDSMFACSIFRMRLLSIGPIWPISDLISSGLGCKEAAFIENLFPFLISVTRMRVPSFGFRICRDWDGRLAVHRESVLHATYASYMRL